ncbi:MAG: ribulose-phosphate 3-epimerase [Clostridia bacterium]|nr:ribulose-phosphate 3-epimerase [Clostridia bacterium]
MVKISPSLLACNFTKIGEEMESIRIAGADMAHLDIMDGVFVTNISFGLPVVSAIRKHSDMFLDVHLMIINPEKYIDRFIDAGADLITFHIEATNDPEACIAAIQKRGKKAALSVKPNTPIEAVYPFLDRCDMILIMTVEPGYGGQSLIPECLKKVSKLRAEIQKRKIDVAIQVDGGINEKTAKSAIEAGADILVAGSSVFNNQDRKAAIDALRCLT